MSKSYIFVNFLIVDTIFKFIYQFFQNEDKNNNHLEKVKALPKIINMQLVLLS